MQEMLQKVIGTDVAPRGLDPINVQPVGNLRLGGSAGAAPAPGIDAAVRSVPAGRHVESRPPDHDGRTS
jgi:hypothetical protein